MSFIRVDASNIDREHICCALSDKPGENGVASKKAWLMERFCDGLVFRKLDVRGKVFIEYLPAEKAWCPVLAEGYMHIDCLWVSGRYQGQGHANALLEQCIDDARAQGKCGLTVLSSTKKLPFLSDPNYMKYKGFLLADTAKPSYELLYLPFTTRTAVPRFAPCVKGDRLEEKGLTLYYSHQCPFTPAYAPLVTEVAERYGVPARLYLLEHTEQARNAPTPLTTYSLFYDGEFITHEILSEKKLERLLQARLR